MISGPKDLGERIKQLRRSKKLTLTELSERSGVAVSTLSKIENGQATGSVDTIFKIARGLKVLFDNLFELSTQPQPNGRCLVTKQGQAERVATEHYDYEVHAAGLVNKHMLPLFMTIKAREPAAPEDWSSHPGEEYVLVLSGSVDLHTEHYAPMRLETGESAYFDSLMKHCYVACSEEPPHLISVCLSDSPRTDSSMKLIRIKTGG